MSYVISKFNIQFSILSIIAAVSTGMAIEKFGININYKFPNDIFLDDGKVSGILIEEHNNNWIIGIGVNIKDSPKCNDYKTSYLNSINKSVSKNDIMHEILYMINNNLYVTDFSYIKNIWMEKCNHLDKFINISDGRSGIFKYIDENGIPHLS